MITNLPITKVAILQAIQNIVILSSFNAQVGFASYIFNIPKLGRALCIHLYKKVWKRKQE